MSPPHRNRRKAAVTASGRRDRAKNTIPTSILKKPTNKRGIIKTQKKTRRSSRRFTASRHDPSDLLSDDDNADAEGSESGSSDEEEDEEPKPREFAPSDALESELHGIEIEDVPTPSPSDQEKEHQVGLEDGVMDEDGGLISLGDFVFGALDAKLPEVDVDDSCDESMLREVLATEEARNSGMLTDFVYTYDQLRDSESSSEDEVDDNKIEEEETFALINEFSKPDAEWDCVQLTSHKELKAHVAVEQAMFQTSDESDRETTSIMNFSLPFEDDEDDDFDFTSNFALSEMNSAFTTPKATAPVSPSSSIFPFSTPFSTGLLTPSSLRRPTQDPDDTEDEAITEVCVKPAQISLRDRKKMLATSRIQKPPKSKGSLPKMGKFSFSKHDTVVGPSKTGGVEVIHSAKRSAGTNTPRGIQPWDPYAAAFDFMNPNPPQFNAALSVAQSVEPRSPHESVKENFQLNQTLGSLLVMSDP